MYKKLNILDEKDKRLRIKSKEVEFPLSKEDKNINCDYVYFLGKILYEMIIQQSIDELTYSQIEEYAEKYKLRPGMGLAFPQLGLNKRIIIIVHEVEEGIFDNYVFINPKIVSYSEEMIAADVGEGCLSVNREVEGHVPRHARVTVEGYDEDGNKIRVRAREELSIAFQHEIDHLEGILFFDRIDKDNPFFDEDEIRLI